MEAATNPNKVLVTLRRLVTIAGGTKEPSALISELLRLQEESYDGWPLGLIEFQDPREVRR